MAPTPTMTRSADKNGFNIFILAHLSSSSGGLFSILANDGDRLTRRLQPSSPGTVGARFSSLMVDAARSASMPSRRRRLAPRYSSAPSSSILHGHLPPRGTHTDGTACAERKGSTLALLDVANFDEASVGQPARVSAALFSEKSTTVTPLERLSALRAPTPARSQPPQILR